MRHGATEWSRSGRHTSRTDLPLLPEGEAEALELKERLGGTDFTLVLTSPRTRARSTAALAGYPDAVVEEDLREWDYGAYEGLTRAQIADIDPRWEVWTGPTPDGESGDEVEERLDRVIDRVLRADRDVVVFSHGHLSRALAARWIGQPLRLGASLQLGTAAVSVLGHDRGTRVIERWNH
ncbi:histidine phosphatase family protein [Pimelobacter simplex]|uniref:histidine phosphatase family protein n=1 Tax=Nocardioides simplex TaxID=2045 RepID=UPI0027DCC332